ncbi:MAG: transketolase [Lentisphaeria bacterium]|nr:transketolase [Lentisphaeria bacterium]
MRKAFNEELLKIAKTDPRVFMILADIGYGEIEPFANAFPDRFINCGVAEQNMTGVACGVAMEGNIAITYSIANFPTLRCFEQIRNDVCYHNANVKIVIIGGGLAYGPLGISHHSTEDLAVMRALPNMVCLSPCDIPEAREAVKAMMAYNGPVYYRCGYKGEKDIHEKSVSFRIGGSAEVKGGRDLTVLFTGTVGINAKEAVLEAAREGIDCRLVSMYSIKPIDKEAILRAATETGKIITVEEHNLYGGLGGAVAEVLCDANVSCKFKRMALPDVNVSKIGSQEWLRDQYGLGVKDILAEIRRMAGK